MDDTKKLDMAKYLIRESLEHGEPALVEALHLGLMLELPIRAALDADDELRSASEQALLLAYIATDPRIAALSALAEG
jgi:hypothetical protein